MTKSNDAKSTGGNAISGRWSRRPNGSNWGDFGEDDQIGRLNLLTAARVRAAVAEVREGKVFCLSLPLTLPGDSVLNPLRKGPRLLPVRDGEQAYPLMPANANHTDLVYDEAVHLYSQYSTHWDALCHIGSIYDAKGDGKPDLVLYNGYKAPVEEPDGKGGKRVGTTALGIEHMAAKGIQGRGVLVDLHAHFGVERKLVGYDDMMRIFDRDKIVVEEGDLLCLRTGFAGEICRMGGRPDASIRQSCPVLDGGDPALLRWLSECGIAALICDNQAVEQGNMWTLLDSNASAKKHAGLPLHEHCIFKLGLPIGELWFFEELAEWLRTAKRSRFFLTATPLRLPGAAGSPVTPLATV